MVSLDLPAPCIRNAQGGWWNTRFDLPGAYGRIQAGPPRRASLVPRSVGAAAVLVLLAGLGTSQAQDSPAETNVIVEFGAVSGMVSERQQTIYVGLHVTFPNQGLWPTGTVEYATVDGTAKGGLDYVSIQGTYEYFPGGSPLQPYLVVQLLEDTEVEGDEFFFLTLRNPQNGAALGSRTNLTIVIHDNDTLAGPGLGPSAAAPGFRGFYGSNKAVVTGGFRAVDGIARAGIARLNPDTTLDESFELSDELCTRLVAVAAQRDGRILLAGCFTNAETQSLTYQPMFRVTTEGTLDPSFSAYVLSTCCNGDGPIRQILPQPDGRIVISGLFTNVNGIGQARIVRLEQDGRVDPQFIVGALPGYGSPQVTLLPDGRYLLVLVTEAIIRLNPDGSRDSTFNLQTNEYCSFQPWVTAAQPDGKVLVGASFCPDSPDGARMFKFGLVRFNADGSKDGTFIGTNDFQSGAISTVALQPDGRVLVGGYFERVNGLARACLARLNQNGSVEENFPTASGQVTFVGVRPDEKIFLNGWFTSIAGVQRYYVALLNLDGTLVCHAHPRSPVLLSSGEFQFSLRGYEEGACTVDASTDLQHWTPIHTNAAGNLLLNFTDPMVAGTPLRFFRTRVLPP